ncbi:MAG: hypothetical protein PUD58_08660 [Prevotella sp.]|uniref:hypothetical protein n=1 Tax=Prevotella sp. TaxID=59823 RepID=UPI00258F35EF|nr:hypothetical protein [Prevotella sp.]MDD6854353.1 hypothetical protein [Prevotella sp.]
MFDLFSQIGGGVFSQRLGHLLREGMKPSPALGKCDQCMIIKESIWSQQKSDEVRKKANAPQLRGWG